MNLLHLCVCVYTCVARSSWSGWTLCECVVLFHIHSGSWRIWFWNDKTKKSSCFHPFHHIRFQSMCSNSFMADWHLCNYFSLFHCEFSLSFCDWFSIFSACVWVCVLLYFNRLKCVLFFSFLLLYDINSLNTSCLLITWLIINITLLHQPNF